METVEQKTQKKQNITKENNLDLSQYETIPALDRALAESEEPEVSNTWEEYLDTMKKWKEEWDKEDNL